MTISDWLGRAKARLETSGCPDPDIDARWIAEDCLGMTRAELKFESDRAVDREQLYRLEAMLDRRAAGEPVQYILGSADFMGLRFEVTPDVLIPRQDTETLVENALIDLRARDGAPALLDLCAGSGCIGLSLASLAPDAKVTLADVSREALDVARRNMHALGVKAELKQGDLFAAVGKERFDVIASNPPYIPRPDLAGLQREVTFEPRLALDGGEDGLDFYRRIAETAGDHLKRGGAIYLEVGIGEAGAVLALLKAHLPCVEAGTIKDLNGVERVVYARM
ncbi:MAG: peptide chain release factor N(5)-glutamine methyltransferase [Clostridia bacterium]|nr:peptide chain release factor N(5)-glutamine methyltransferase [Clostridia bacterium]MBR6890036.1 peptide chain release factor N(5)-glutamine methyltransferase [Clostridia bacterium]